MTVFILSIVIALVAGSIAFAVTWARSTVSNPRCCEHNRCPSRPANRLHRFENRPWRCVECGQWWRTKYAGIYYWTKIEDAGFYHWTTIEDSPRTDQWRADS